MDAVISSIRRNAEESKSAEKSIDFKKVFIEAKISCKNKVASIIFKKDEATTSLLPEVFSVFDFYNGETLRLIKGAESIEFIFDEKNLGEILKIFSEKKIVKTSKDIGEVTIYFGSGVEHTPGVFATILNELAINGINVHEAISCLNEYMIYVGAKDLSKTYQLLFDLCERYKHC